MEYLKEYEKQTTFIDRNFVKKYILQSLDRKWKNRGQDSSRALYFNRVLKVTGVDIDSTAIAVLEVGGGNGDFMCYHHDNIRRKIMIDIDSFYKDKFKSMGIEFYNKDLSRESMVNIANGSVDIIMLNHLIEHISDIGFFIAEIKRMLKNGGKVYIRTPDIEKVKFSFYDDFTHVKPFSKHGLKHMMNVFGFKELATINSNSDTLKLEEYFDVKPGALSFLGAKEIESAWEKIQS